MPEGEDKVVDLMAALEKSIANHKAARLKREKERNPPPHSPQQHPTNER